MAFRSLLYTDCRADESLSGGTGYQFQAASSDVQPADETVMLQDLMYRPSPDLMAREAPVTEYPPSFAYAKTDDGYAVGAGVYLGRVSGDARQGNQITHGVFTSDLEDLSTTRPAQLFGADFWTAEKQPSKQLPTIEAPLIYREEFDLEALHEIATQGADAEGFLAKVLSAFEHATAEAWVKVVISSGNPETVMQWIALGTMLLPTPQALGLSIRVFVPDPVTAGAHIVAVHPPSMNRPPDVTTLQFVSGIDLDGKRTGRIDVTERAAYWAGKFTAGDPYEVIDAIELAGRLSASEPTNRTVAGLVMLSESLTNADTVNAVAEAFESFDAEEYEEFAGPLVDALELAEQQGDLTPEPFASIRRAIVRHGGATSELSDRVQSNVLLRASTARDFAVRLVDDASLDWAWQRPPAADSTAARSLLATIAAAEDGELSAVFAFALRTGVSTTPEDVRDSARRLADHWVTHPELVDRHPSWIHPETILQLMVQSLQRDVATGPTPAVNAAIEQGQWDWLLDVDWVLRSGGPLAAEIASRSLLKAEPRKREYLITRIASATGAGGWVPLWRNRSPDLDEAMFWLAVRPMDVWDPRFAVAIGPGVGRVIDAGRIRGQVLRLIRDIYTAAPDKLPPNVARLGRQNVELTRDVQSVIARRDKPDIGRRLAGVDPQILRIRLGEVIEALIGNAKTDDTAAFLEHCSIDATETLIAKLDALAKLHPAAALKYVFLLADHKLPKSTGKALKAFPLQWYESASDEARAQMGVELGEAWPQWDEMEAEFERKHESTVKKVGRLFNREKGR
ncbi:hypothetical protein [Mycobacterium sp. NPDC050041]|uniref:GAP1-N2 domain-containing protein n=1 Tax=Mycobacterium sp. NPDC050041 TaxID=3364293 RepID=UPI003C2C3460